MSRTNAVVRIGRPPPRGVRPGEVCRSRTPANQPISQHNGSQRTQSHENPRASDPQLKMQLAQQTLEPASVSAGFHTHTHTLLLERAVKLLGFFAMSPPPLAELTYCCVHKCNLLEARMIVTTYNQHVQFLSSESFGWFAPPKSTRAWEPTLLRNHLTQ
jgi:hypothetical protein